MDQDEFNQTEFKRVMEDNYWTMTLSHDIIGVVLLLGGPSGFSHF
jgi:hypothetical protein